MRLPFLWVGLGFAMGVVLEKYGQIPVLWPACVLGPGLILLWFLRGRRIFLPLFIICLACAGILWARLDAHVPANAVQNFISSERITLRGVVDALPEMKTRGKKTTVSLVLKAKSISRQENGRWKFHKVIGLVQVFLLQAPVLPQVGDELRLYGTLSAPRTVLNPGEFDYKSFLAQKNVHAIFQTIGKKSVRLTKAGNPWAPARMIAASRRYLAELVDKIYQPQEAAIVKALVLGLRSNVSPEVRSQFMKTGTIHLLAISGMNITMIAGTFYLMFLFFGMGFRRSSWITILIVIFYVGLAGSGIPIQRAGYGAVLVLFAVLAGRPVHLLNSLCFAFFVILVWNPQSFWNIGFQLSFLCVFSLILILPLLARVNTWILSLGSSLAVLFGTFPVVIYYFNVFSPVSVLANIVAIPLCDAALFISLFSLLFAGVPFLSIIFVKFSSWIITCSLVWVKCLSAWRWGYWFFERPSFGLLAAYYLSLGMILFFHRRVFYGKRFLLTCFISCWIGFSAQFFISSGGKEFKLTMLASGRNQIMCARFSNGAYWLLNAGRSFPSDHGEWLIAPFLRNQGVQRLEGILFSDLYKKHTGGLSAVLRDFPVRYLLYPAASLYGPDEFHKNLLKLGRKAKNFQPDDEVLMGPEKIRMIAQSQKGSAFLVQSGPWRILFISRWESGLFRELLRTHEATDEIHAVFLPAAGQEIPIEFRDWLEQTQPLLLIFPDLPQVLVSYFSSCRVPCVALRHAGALCFRRKGPRLELASFMKGPLGVYSYP